MAKRLPHGMTANMMAIMRVEAKARESGVHYGAYTGCHDTSQFKGKARKKKPPCICEICGEEIVFFGARNRRVCDDCREKRKRENEEEARRRRESGEWERPEVEVRCCICGVSMLRHSLSTRQKCDECKAKEAEHRRKEKELERTRSERELVKLFCVSCGKEVVRKRTVANVKCAECKKAANRENMKEHMRTVEIIKEGARANEKKA